MSGASFGAILRCLTEAGVEFVVIGGVAGMSHGLARVTYDVDVVYARSDENLDRLVAALADHAPYLRGAPPGLPFRWDRQTIRGGLNFTLTTDLGALDLLGEATGGGTFTALSKAAEAVEMFGVACLRVDLDDLIRLKRAAGRPKDLEAIAELEALREERGGSLPGQA